MDARGRAPASLGPIDSASQSGAVPDAEAGESYGMPALRYRGRPLISVIAIKAGYVVYPFSPEVVTAALPSLPGFASTKGGVKFAAEQPVPEWCGGGGMRSTRR